MLSRFSPFPTKSGRNGYSSCLSVRDEEEDLRKSKQAKKGIEPSTIGEKTNPKCVCTIAVPQRFAVAFQEIKVFRRPCHKPYSGEHVLGRFKRGVTEREVFTYACQYIVSPRGRTGNRTVTQMRHRSLVEGRPKFDSVDF